MAGAVAFPAWAGEPTVVPVKKAPFHLFTFEDENMSLENVTLPPGRSTRYHSHDQDLVFVITAGAKITNQVLGKEPVTGTRGEGTADRDDKLVGCALDSPRAGTNLTAS